MKFLVTAGPTREPIDPVRFISNRSSGKMGYALAAAALEAGHEVALISGPVCIAPPQGADLLRVTTADEMADAVQTRMNTGCDVLIMCAAVADFKPRKALARKIKKHVSSSCRRATSSLRSRCRAIAAQLLLGSPRSPTRSRKTRKKNCARSAVTFSAPTILPAWIQGLMRMRMS